MSERLDSMGYPMSDFQREHTERSERASAEEFKSDPRMERLIALRAEDRAEFNGIVKGGLRMSLAGYESAKVNAARHGK
ncbi:hypothetical protein ACFU6I_46405 [Streptomyces sp. NPDC057486]|uniref:hypothetical protein n=1 Tax=Streptomyces sp. NPDC057486 TaxID=3346145 RepID=UPI0036C63A4D